MKMISVNDVVDKVLYAAKRIPVKKLPLDNGEIIGFVDKDQKVGKVISYLEPKDGRRNLYWMFEDKNGMTFYVEHVKGYFNKQLLKEQLPVGPVTWKDTVKKTAFGLAGLWAVVQLGKAFIRR